MLSVFKKSVLNSTKQFRSFSLKPNETLTGSRAKDLLAKLGITSVPTIHYNLVMNCLNTAIE